MLGKFTKFMARLRGLHITDNLEEVLDALEGWFSDLDADTARGLIVKFVEAVADRKVSNTELDGLAVALSHAVPEPPLRVGGKQVIDREVYYYRFRGALLALRNAFEGAGVLEENA